MKTLSVTQMIARPAAVVWAVVADYERDPEWRRGVSTMQPEPPGPVEVGTTTAEVLRLGGRTYRNGGEVTSVDAGRSFTWRTTTGADAKGSRSVRPLGPHRCEVTLELAVRARGRERLLQPLLLAVLHRTLQGDLRRLAELVTDRGAAEARAALQSQLAAPAPSLRR